MTSQVVGSWGNLGREAHEVLPILSRHAPLPLPEAPAISVLPFGNGRSYGDSCLNRGGGLILTRRLDRFIDWKPDDSTITCESGMLLAELLQFSVPRGWFVPVTPGTELITLGGAVANDVHGKNHHRAGTFGRYVRRLELLRSDGRRLICSREENADWFAATVGGLGLTGLITWVELELRRIPGPWMHVESIRFRNLEEFFDLERASSEAFEYTVAWIDCLARGAGLGRGLLQRANHAGPAASQVSRVARPRRLGVPFVPPLSLINSGSLRLFNTIHYHLGSSAERPQRRDYRSFFYPLDRIAHWNRLYGPRGMFQYQCVIPGAQSCSPLITLLQAIAASRLGSFLAVLKRFGTLTSPGMLSFPREGVTLALDFPNRGEPVERLFRELDAIVAAAGGRLYPAKDARMPASLFRAGYPRWMEFSRYVDPRCSSSFWRRMMEPL